MPTPQAAPTAALQTGAVQTGAGGTGVAAPVGEMPSAGETHRGRNIAIAAGAFVAVLAVCAAVVLVLQRGSSGDVLDVTLQPIGDRGAGPFTASVVSAKPGTLQAFASRQRAARSKGSSQPAGAATSAPTDSGGLTTRTVAGDTSGLYGVDAATPVADGNRLIDHLTAKPAAASAWASAMGVPDAAISTTVHALTPVVLTHDTALTVHDFVAGHAGTHQAILQAGSVVFIDVHGRPAVAAASGNPLGPPRVTGGSDISFHGDRWTGFDQHDVTTVDAAHDELHTIDGVDVHTGAPATVGVGGTVTLDGYVVSDRNGVSVVSEDGKTTTRIVDHPVGQAFGDGLGGIVYEDDVHRDPSLSGENPHAISWLAAGKVEPTTLAEVDEADVVLRILGTGRFNGTDVLFYAKQDNTSTAGVSNQGAGSQLIVHDLASGKEHLVTAAPGFSESPDFLGFTAMLANEGFVGDRHLIYQETQGTGPALFAIDEQYQVHDIDAQVCYIPSRDDHTCFAHVVAPSKGDQVDFVTQFSGDDGDATYLTRVDLSSSSIVSRTPLTDTWGLDCDGELGSVNSDATRTVVSVGQTTNGWSDCRAGLVDPTTHEVTPLGFGGFVVPLSVPVIRPAAASSGAGVPSTTAAPAPSSPGTTASPGTTPTTRPAARSMNLDEIAAGDYTSLLGTWTEVAMAVNPHDGTGPQWRTEVQDTLVITKDTITLNERTVLRGDTLTYDVGNGPVNLPFSFESEGDHLAGSNSDDNVINFVFSFYPKGSTDLATGVTPNNGVTISNDADTIYFWSSNNGYTAVFARTS